MKLIFLHGMPGVGKLSFAERFRELREAGAFVNPEMPAARLVLDTAELSAPDAAGLIGGEPGLK
ncbi:MAG TPA: hypothetical protein VM936_00260 [Pyrinomonadaceae bacterium]|nr:hypothetical protein [Pyrinomonadaceae bacterium]